MRRESLLKKGGGDTFTIKWQNPKQFLPLLLFLGVVLVVSGTGIESFTANSTLTKDGWIVVAVAVFLWIFQNGKRRH